MIKIRQAINTDLPAILQMQETWLKENITYGYIEPKEKILLKYNKEYFYVAEKDEKIIAYIACEVIENNKSVINIAGKYLEISDVYVTKSERKEGIGKMLIDKVEELAKTNGLTQIQLCSSVKDIKKIIKFYESCGFNSFFIRMFKDLNNQ
jgi:ribosomal protein S18 acetylase RimI-like enzyme